MQLEFLALKLRARGAMEAADLGIRLCQDAARSVYPCLAVASIPVVAISLASWEVASWLPAIVIMLGKPWLDRTVLFVMARAAFGQRTTPMDVWRAQRHVWWSQLLLTLTLQRLSPWRSLTQPVYQLEGVSWSKAAERVRQIRRRTAGSASLLTLACAAAEMALGIGSLSLMMWLMPGGTVDFGALFSGEPSPAFAFAAALNSALLVIFLEPFYVAAGFAMYLNRRTELEAWDIEQEFRRAFAA